MLHGGSSDITNSFRLSDDDWNSYSINAVRGTSRLEAYFVNNRNIVIDQERSFQRRQEDREPVASYVNDVYDLAKYCNFGALHAE